MILNITQHNATPDQKKAGVVDLAEEDRKIVSDLLTFDTVPTIEEMARRATKLADVCKRYGAKRAMIGGAPFFMSTLETILESRGIKPCYAFSKRVVVEETQEDGSVVKKNIFRHEGFVEL